MNIKWSPSDKEYIKNNYKEKTDRQLLRHFNRGSKKCTLAAVRKLRQRMGLSKKGGLSENNIS